MEQSSQAPLVDTLKRFIPLQALAEAQLAQLAVAIATLQIGPGEQMIARGSHDPFSFFLVKGKIRLSAADGKEIEISEEDASARNPISQLIPRKYEVTARTPVEFLKIHNELLSDMASRSDSSSVPGYQVAGDSDQESGSEFEDHVSLRLMQELENDQLHLPSLPDVAARIGKALRDDVSDADQIARMIQNDPVITAKLIKAANSALYGRRTAVESCAAAVVRLGSDVTHKLVLSYAMRELFKTESGLLQQKMKELWRHSTRVAAICYVLARHDERFNPEQAMLIGLMHDIGVVAILNYATSLPMEMRQPEVVEPAIQRLRGQIGSLILRKWGFGNEFIVSALEAEEWFRNQGGTPDYCDLVIIAQLHSYIGTQEAYRMPAINEVPAHRRLALGELSPRMSLKILDEAKEQIDQAEAILNF